MTFSKVKDIVLYVKSRFNLIEVGDVVYFYFNWKPVEYECECKYEVLQIENGSYYLEIIAMNLNTEFNKDIVPKSKIINKENRWHEGNGLSLEAKMKW